MKQRLQATVLATVAAAGVLTAAGVPSAQAASSRHLCSGVPQAPVSQVPMTLTVGTASVKVTWYDDGDPSVLSYKVIAVPQQMVKGTQPPYKFKTMGAGAGCVNKSVTITGLKHKVGYLFWLDEISKSYEHPSAHTEATVGISYLVYPK